ncbi:MAG: ParB/RepB/Spo0J family partition protein, partial [Phycisphaerae bacterium]|nr:ParB/RepB/Spo0J family partition protein [Phycisphaerae bacterium]
GGVGVGDGVGAGDGVGSDGAEGIVMVGVGLVSANPWQPRQRFDEGALGGLADSIKRSGLMQPIVVRPAPVDEATGRSVGYELVAGERRWRAAQIAGLERVPAVVRRLSDVEAAEWSLVENLEREDLNPMDQGWALRRMGEKFGLTQGEIAERVGLERSSVANLVRLTELDEETAGLVAGGRLSAGHGKVLLGVSAVQSAMRATLAKRAVREEWSVRRTEREVAAFVALGGRAAAPGPTRHVSPAGADLERRLSEHLGTKVIVTTDRSGKNGRVMIDFYGLDHLDGVLEKMGVKRKG